MELSLSLLRVLSQSLYQDSLASFWAFDIKLVLSVWQLIPLLIRNLKISFKSASMKKPHNYTDFTESN
jgi:hypothetical protein